MRRDRTGGRDGPRVGPVVLLLMLAAAAAPGPARGEASPVRLTVEVSWRSVAPGEAAPGAEGVSLALSAGRVVGALAWPESGDAADVPRLAPPEAGPDGAWRLGVGATGRVRARVEAPIDAALSVRGPAVSWTVPLLALLDGPQRSPLDGGGVIEVRRLPWDALEVEAPGDGTAAPGAVVPVNVGVNVLAPEPTEVELLLSTRLRAVRADRVLWDDSRRLVIPTNAAGPPVLPVAVPMPAEEGTYVLELTASWSPREPQAEGSRLGRWWRRLRNRSTDVAVRRVSLAVVNPAGPPPAGAAPQLPRRPGPERADAVVDSAELGRPRGLRPRAEGRSPAAADRPDAPWPVPAELLVDPMRRERLWSLLGRVGSDFRALPPAGADGASWAAVPLKVPRPDRPHRLDLTVVGGDPAGMAVALVAPGPRPRLLLDARGSGPSSAGLGPQAVHSWTVWPDASDPVLIVVNRSAARPLWLGDARLVELADEPAPLPVAVPPPGAGRALAVRLAGPADLQRFGGLSDSGPDDPMARGRHLAAYLGSIGASAAVLPPPAPDRAIRAALGGQAAEDPIGPDFDRAVLAALRRRGIAAIVEAELDGAPLPGLPAPGDPEAERLGLARLDRSGAAEAGRPAYNLLRPEVQRALTRHLLALAGGPGAPPSHRPDGLLVRLGPGPTLPGRPDAGLDDATYARFVRDAIKGEVAPGLDPADPGRFAARHRYVTGPALVPWLGWRSRQVGSYYAGLAAAMAEAAPGVSVMVATPGLDDGPAGAEARRFDRDGLPPDAAWRALGLDLADWPRGDGPAPFVLRGAGTGAGDLERDLATHPALDAQVLTRPARGLLIGLDGRSATPPPGAAGGAGLLLSAVPDAPGPEADELLGHGLAALDAGWVVVSSSSAAGREERLRAFARAYRALPRATGPAGSAAGGAVARAMTVGDGTYVAMANDTPYPLRLTAVIAAPPSAPIEDLGRGIPPATEAVPGGRRVLIDLPPFGVSALRVGASGARLASVAAGFDPGREAHREAVARRLQALAAGGSIAHLNPGFEPESAVRRASSADGEAPDERAGGWSAEGPAGASAAIDAGLARTGRGSLRLDAPEAPAAAASPPFLPPGPSVTLRAFLRTDPPDAAVRVRIESEPGAAGEVRLAADLPAADRADWAPMALRAPGLPADGSSMIRLRFELRSPGRLWVDDLTLAGPGLTQARSCLTAALQAYEEGRFADFARLARSHWVLEAGGPIEPAPEAPIVAPLAGEVSTDLPARSRLR